jgi:hypothetical protein
MVVASTLATSKQIAIPEFKNETRVSSNGKNRVDSVQVRTRVSDSRLANILLSAKGPVEVSF